MTMAAMMLDLYLVDGAGRPVSAFPDLPGLTIEQTYVYHPDHDRLVAELAAAGMIGVGVRPPEITQDDDEADDAFRAREDHRLREACGAEAGIALHKLRGDDASGWWVTPTEAMTALTAWAAAGKPEFSIDGLPEFLFQAAQYGGFRVWQTR